jgi:phage shock protein A
MIQQMKNETKKIIKEYNEQCDLIDELQNERKTLQEKITNLKNDKFDDKYIIRTLKKKLKILETIQNRIRNVRESIISSFALFSSHVNRIAEMTANINASNRLEKTKRSIVISNSTIFIEDKTKFEH